MATGVAALEIREDRPVVAEALGHRRRVNLGAERFREHAHRRRFQPGNANARPVGRPHAVGRADRRPYIANQGAPVGLVERTRRHHAAGGVQNVIQSARIVASQQADPNGRSEDGEAAVRMEISGGPGKSPRNSGHDFVSDPQAAKDIGYRRALRFRLGQQGRQHIDAGMADRNAVAFVQFAPAAGRGVCGCGGVAVGADAAAVEHGRLRLSGKSGHAVLELSHFRLVSAGNDSRQVVDQNSGGSPANRLRNIMPTGAGRPCGQVFDGRGGIILIGSQEIRSAHDYCPLHNAIGISFRSDRLGYVAWSPA